VVQAARALLAAVTRLLVLADMIDVMCLLQHVSSVSRQFALLLFSVLIPILKQASILVPPASSLSEAFIR
jgi:hypothetical protein